jgi:hypothetical protein
VLVVVVAVLILAAGAVGAVLILGDDDSDVVGSTTQSTSVVVTTPSTPTTLDAQAQARAAVIEAYKKSYQGFIAVGKETLPNPIDPRLTDYSTGTALVAKQRALADNKSKGLVLTGDAELHPTVIELGSDTATVVDCAIDRTGLADARTGAVAVGPGNGEGGALTAKLIREGGAWKVTSFKDEKRSCVPPAA